METDTESTLQEYQIQLEQVFNLNDRIYQARSFKFLIFELS